MAQILRCDGGTAGSPGNFYWMADYTIRTDTGFEIRVVGSHDQTSHVYLNGQEVQYPDMDLLLQALCGMNMEQVEERFAAEHENDPEYV